ncbi:unnamed protein product [Parajaminaea phylloscopi]
MIVIPLARPEVPPLPPSVRSPATATSGHDPRNAAPGTRVRRSKRAASAAQHRSDDSSRQRSASVSSASSPSASCSQPQSARSTPEVAVPNFATCSSAAHRDLARVWEAVSGSRRIVVVTGAGISVSSPANIPDFRSSTGLFRSLKEQHPNAGLSSGKDLFDARLFQSEANTSLFYSMIAQLHEMTLSAQPTLFHHFLKRLDEQGRLQRVYTQNIDALEERAGLTFGLGEGAKRTFQRTASLGKRKRTAQMAAMAAAEAAAAAQASASASGAETDNMPAMPARRRPAWSKAQSAPAIAFASGSAGTDEASAMFPRVIPLHGSLASLVCTVCDFKLATLPEPNAEVQGALKSLQEGEAPLCPACSERDSVRIAAGLRSRGIGLLKPDVVLYNGDNKSGERVGECLERDVLGLRDRLDGRVPETFAEERVRVKREAKAREKDDAAMQQQQQDQSQSFLDVSCMSIDNTDGEMSTSDVLGKAFEDEEEDEKEAVLQCLAGNSLPPPVEDAGTDSGKSSIVSPTAKLLEGVRARKTLQRCTTQPALSNTRSSASDKATAPAKLKPLPPDLLIVAGTSLKVPGTKRVVREFAKAARARDGIVPKGCASRAGNASRENSKTPSSRSRSASWESASDAAGSEGEGSDEDEDLEDGTDPARPIRTILLNYDFPIPSKEWDGVFDVWVQGDVQAAAGGLWDASAGYRLGNPLPAEGSELAACEEEGIAGVRSWELSMGELKSERDAMKKAERAERAKEKAQENADGKSSRKAEAQPDAMATATATATGESPRIRGLAPAVVIPLKKGAQAARGPGTESSSRKTQQQQAKAAKGAVGVDTIFRPLKRGAKQRVVVAGDEKGVTKAKGKSTVSSAAAAAAAVPCAGTT